MFKFTYLEEFQLKTFSFAVTVHRSY